MMLKSSIPLAILLKEEKEQKSGIVRLNTNLQNEIDKLNADASLLRRIKEAVEKATATIEAEIKNLVDQLTATSATTKSRIKSLIEAVGNISNIIFPNET